MKTFLASSGVGILMSIYFINLSRAQVPDCIDSDVNAITFDIEFAIRLEVEGSLFVPYADVSWIVDNPANAPIDGFAVHFLDVATKQDDTVESRSILPNNTCYSGSDHIWVITPNQTVCDTSASAPQCSQSVGVVDACLCPLPNCSLFPSPTCRSVLELLGPDYDFHLTVLPTVTDLQYPVQDDTTYEFSISPYYREFANLSPTTKRLESVAVCDEDVSYGTAPCILLVWPGFASDTLVVEVNQTVQNDSINVQTVSSVNDSLQVCGLEVCAEYTLSAYIRIFGSLQLLTPVPVPFQIRFNVADGTSVNATAGPTVPSTTGDPCLSLRCDFNGRCVDVGDGNVTCGCNPGYFGDGFNCTDIDECLDASLCTNIEECVNTDGSFFCDCIYGYEPDGFTCRTSPPSLNETVSTTPQMDLVTGVTDQIDCPGNCHVNATCVDTIGGYTCTCISGYTGDGTFCVDEIDCPGNCHVNATCLDTIGNYTCTCKSGYTGNGTFCEDEIDCPGDCHGNASCMDTIGDYICTCKSGYTGNGTFCEDTGTQSVNESTTTPPAPTTDPTDEIDCPGNCHVDATCLDTIGSYTCTCKLGYIGNGFFCEVISADCTSTQIIAGFTFPPTQAGLPSYSEEKCEESAGPSCPRVPVVEVGPCIEECNQTSAQCGDGLLCCSTGCGHICDEGLNDIGSGDVLGGTGTSIASIRCVRSQDTGTAGFDISTLITINCVDTVEELTSPPYDDVSRKLDVLQVSTSNTDELTETDVQQVTQFLQGIAGIDEQFSENDIEDVAEIASHLSQYYAQDNRDDAAFSVEKQNLVESIDVISRKLDGTTNNFNADSNDVNIAVQDISDANTTLTFAARFYSGSAIFSPIQITIPSEAISQAESQVNQVRVVYIGFRGSNLFPTEQTTDWVIASSLGDRNTSLERLSLAQPVQIINNEIEEQPEKVPVSNFKDKLTKVECVFWDFDLGSWSSDGCSLVSTSPATCECNHLTNFAILVSTKEIPANFALTVVSYIGCGLSIICLICTVLFISLTRRLRKKHPMKIMMNLCSCLAVSLAFFLFGIESGVEKAGCAVLTAFLHYFLLVTWFWMAIYSHTIYRDIVKVLDSYGRSYNMIAACAVGYGVPAVIVILNSSIALAHIDANQPDDPFLESSYIARNFCWLRGNSLYFGFLLPVGILLAFNIVIFCIVIRKITCGRKQLQSSASQRSVKDNLIVALVMATTMGLSWAIGYLMLIADDEMYLIAMSWVFTILNALQGFFIFIFTIVRTGEMKTFFRTSLPTFSSTGTDKPSSTNFTGLTTSSPPRSPAPDM